MSEVYSWQIDEVRNAVSRLEDRVDSLTAVLDQMVKNFANLRADLIQVTVPLAKGTPTEIVADWLEENGRVSDAAFLRGLTHGS